jgi:chemotaxis protein CheC
MVTSITMEKQQKEIWDNLIKKGITNAMTGLSQMVGQDIGINSVEIEEVLAKRVPEMMGGPDALIMGIYLTFSGAANGHIMLAHSPEVANAFLNMLLGGEHDIRTSIDEMEQSALGEMGNVTSSFFLNSVADSLGVLLSPSTPLMLLDIAGAVLDVALAEILLASDYVFSVKTSFVIKDAQIEGAFMVLPNKSFLDLPVTNGSR